MTHLAVSTMLLVPVGASAQLPRIRLTSVFPPAATAGAKQNLSISGELSEAATSLVFSHAGIRANQLIDGPGEFAAAHRKPRQFELDIDDDVPAGRYDVRALGPAGLSAARTLLVTKMKGKSFDANGNSKANAYEFAVDEVVNARARPDQRDWYRFAANAGDRLLIQLWADRIDSQMDGVLSVYAANSGRRLAHLRQDVTRDPVFTFQPPESGDYLIEVRDATYRGGDAYPYVLEVSRRANVEGIHPVLAKEGVASSFQVFGHNLPGGKPVSGNRSGLQSLEIEFTPQFTGAFARALPLGTVAASHVDGGAVALPAPFGGTALFMNRMATDVADLTLEQGDNDAHAAAQQIKLPADIAGQFHPRRDVDNYRFEAKKGQTIWLDLATQQLGTTSDPVMRIYRRTMKDGKPTFREVATADDVEATPNNREKRRFHTGTTDAELRFRAPEDGTYVVSVTDQYNTSNDDPRLVYHLAVHEPRPDFQLVAFANPERHGDDKIVKPNGVGLIPGGSATIRVRLLSQQGFNSEVDVVASELPAGVVAYPLRLDSRQKEGLLVLAASADAKPAEAAIRIVGSANVGKAVRTRVARIGVIQTTTNNVDAQPAKTRLADGLPVAVMPAAPSPVVFDAVPRLRSSRGAKLKVPLQFARSESWKDKEIEVSGSTAGGVKLTSVKTKSNVADVVAEFSDAKVKAGRYTISLTAKVKEKRPRNAVAIREAVADIARIDEVIATREAAFKEHEERTAAITSAVAGLVAKYDAEKQQTQEPVNKLVGQLRAQQAAARALADLLEKAIADPGNTKLVSAVDDAESALRQSAEQRSRLQESIAESLAPLTALSTELRARRGEETELGKQLDGLKAKRDEAVKKKQEAERRLADIRKNEEKDVEYWIYAPPVEVELHNSPVTLKTAERRVKLGESFEIPVLVERDFGFNGQLTLKGKFPSESGLQSSAVVLGPGQTIARIQVTATDKAKVGNWTGEVESRLKFNNLQIDEKLPCKIVVTEPEK